MSEHEQIVLIQDGAGLTVDPSCRRRFGRLVQQALHSDIGQVRDLSAGGMKVITGKIPEGESLIVTLRSDEGELKLKARVAWSKRVGLFGKREVGLEFVDVTDAERRQLTRIASAHRPVEHRRDLDD